MNINTLNYSIRVTVVWLDERYRLGKDPIDQVRQGLGVVCLDSLSSAWHFLRLMPFLGSGLLPRSRLDEIWYRSVGFI